jgi:hypothetical protein
MEGRYCPNLCLERLRKTMKIHSQYIDVDVKNRDEHLPNVSILRFGQLSRYHSSDSDMIFSYFQHHS